MSSRRSASDGQRERDHVQAVVQVLAELARARSRSSRSRCVAEMTRTSIGDRLAWRPPAAPRAPAATRSSFTCSASGMSPISSRNSVPPVGRLEQALVVALAPVNAPLRVAEELALEQRLGDRAAVDRDERRVGAPLARWMARASSSLPVPLSPWMSTLASVAPPAARCRSRSSICGLRGDDPGAPRLGRAARPVGDDEQLQRALDLREQLARLERLRQDSRTRRAGWRRPRPGSCRAR